MARPGNLAKMPYTSLIAMRDRIDTLIVQRQTEEKDALKLKLTEMAKASGFELNEIIGNGTRRGKGTVAVKYRDPKNAINTWTGRGRMPLWMVAATKIRGVKKEDFLI